MENQFEEQFQNVIRTCLSVVYVVSGKRIVLDLLADYMGRRIAEDFSSSSEKDGVRKRNVTEVTKYDLLKGHDRRQLDHFTFDQQALVDFPIMFKASAFMCAAHSSFLWAVALRRHEISKYREYTNEGSDLLRDEYTIIMGILLLPNFSMMLTIRTQSQALSRSPFVSLSRLHRCSSLTLHDGRAR
jgi:hypothetical protein